MTWRKTKRVERPAASRRRFTLVTPSMALAVLLPTGVFAETLVEEDVVVPSPDGDMDACWIYPDKRRSPAVVIWPDILGLRLVARTMARRLAAEGYAVLVINPYYREKAAPVAKAGATLRDPEVQRTVLPLYRTLTGATDLIDAAACIAYCAASEAVDSNRKMGVVGYSMGGSSSLRAAGAFTDHIGAGATIHAGGLVTEDADSPHRAIPNMTADYFVAVADGDHRRDPETAATLKVEFAEAGVDALVEVFPGTLHGWCPADSSRYDEPNAERVWSRVFELFERAL